MYKMKSRGPRTDPWGTSSDEAVLDLADPRLTYSVLSARYEVHQSSVE